MAPMCRQIKPRRDGSRGSDTIARAWPTPISLRSAHGPFHCPSFSRASPSCCERRAAGWSGTTNGGSRKTESRGLGRSHHSSPQHLIEAPIRPTQRRGARSARREPRTKIEPAMALVSFSATDGSVSTRMGTTHPITLGFSIAILNVPQAAWAFTRSCWARSRARGVAPGPMSCTTTDGISPSRVITSSECPPRWKSARRKSQHSMLGSFPASRLRHRASPTASPAMGAMWVSSRESTAPTSFCFRSRHGYQDNRNLHSGGQI